MIQKLKRIHWRYWPLAVKLAVMLMVAIVVTAVSITVLSVRREQETFRTELEQQADLLLDVLTASGSDALYFLDLDALADIMESLGEDQLILVSGRFYDTEGRIVADAFDEDHTLTVIPDSLGLALLASEGTVYEWFPNELVAGRAIDIGPQRVGALSIGLPTVQLQAKIDEVQKESLIVALTTAVIGGLIAILFGRTVTGPVQRLMAEADRIAAGDFAHPISVQRFDELTALGNAMEHMRAEMQALTANLENQVVERTQALQESESRFRLLISSISDYIYLVKRDKDGRWHTSYLSPNITLVTGYPHEEFLKDHRFWRSRVHPEDDAEITRQGRDFYLGQNSKAEFRFFHADGRIIWLRDSGRVEQIPETGETIVYGVVSDITEHKAAEQQLANQKRLFENLVVVAQATTGHPTLEETLNSILNVSIMLTEAEKDGRSSLFLCDDTGVIGMAILASGRHLHEKPDASTKKMLNSGLSGWVMRNRQTALIEDTSQDERWIPSEIDEDTAQSALAVPIMSGRTLLAVLTLAHPRQGHFSANHAYLLEAATGQISLALRNAQMHDEQMILANRQRTLYQTLQAVGTHLTQTGVSQAAVTTVAELTPWTAVKILLPNDDITALEVVAATENSPDSVGQTVPLSGILSGEAFRLGETRYQAGANGENGKLAVPLRHGRKKLGVLCLIGPKENVFEDDSVLLAESLADAIGLALDNARLHSELRAAKEVAETANQAKSEFIGVASHELKNPMAAIWGYAEVIVSGMVGEMTPELSRIIEVIKRSVQRMQTLVSDLADLSHIESGYLHMELGQVSIPEVIHESAAILQTMTQEKGQQVTLAVDWSIPDVWGDRNRLVQILVNLLSNANKYTPVGGMIKISAEIFKNDPQMMHVAVADNGLGIIEAEQKELFAKFFRSADKKARGVPGTGLGLNITKRLVELQHGRIWFESEYRVGTTFHFTIPLSSRNR